MSDEEHGTICDIDIVALEKDHLVCGLNLLQKMRDEALTFLTNATDDFKKIDDIYWDNQTTKNKEARHKAKIRLTRARKNFERTDYNYLYQERALTQYKQKHGIQEPKEIADEIANALLTVELAKREYDKAHAEYESAENEDSELVQAKKERNKAKNEFDVAKSKYDKASKKYDELSGQFRKTHNELSEPEAKAIAALWIAVNRIENITNRITGSRK